MPYPDAQTAFFNITAAIGGLGCLALICGALLGGAWNMARGRP